MNIDRITESLKKLQEQLDEVLEILKELQGKKKGKSAARRSKTKPEPLNDDVIAKYKDQFNLLYKQWMGGDEVKVQSELESLEADELRRFADANNLNVTTKSPKQKCLQLIAARFREKRQLTRETPRRENKTINTQQDNSEDPV